MTFLSICMEYVHEVGHRVIFAKICHNIYIRHTLHTYCVHIHHCGNLFEYSSLSWWRHKMETFSALLALCVGNSSVTVVFSLICAWTNGWVNNRDAGDFKHHRAHYDVTVMMCNWTAFGVGTCSSSSGVIVTQLIKVHVELACCDTKGQNKTKDIYTKTNVPNSKVLGANMGPIWVLSAPGGPHVGLMNLANWVICRRTSWFTYGTGRKGMRMEERVAGEDESLSIVTMQHVCIHVFSGNVWHSDHLPGSPFANMDLFKSQHWQTYVCV